MTLDELRPTLLSLIPDVTAPGLTLAEIMNVIQRRLIAGKALDEYMGQIQARLKGMTGVDIGNVDEGLTRAEDRLKSATMAEAENVYMHRIMGRIQAKANALLLNPREKITDVCQALDAVQAEYDHVKSQALKNSDLATARGIMISDAIAGLCEALGTPRTEDVTLAKITDLLKARASEGHEYHKRLCEAVHVLTTTPMDRVVNETVRVIGSRDYYVKALLSRFVNEGVTFNDKTVDEVLAMIEAEQKTLTERLGTSYAREMTLVKELAETKTQLATAGKESADLARALHLSEDKINRQGTDLAEIKHALGQVLKVHDWVMATIRKALHMGEKETVASIEDAIQRLVKLTQDQRTILTGVCGLLGLNVDESTYSDIVDKVGTLVQGRAQVREDLRLAPGERVDLHGLREVLCKAVGLPEFTSMPTVVDRAVEVLSFERKAANMAERSTLARFRDDMRTVLGEKNATAKYMVDTVDEMRRDMASIKSALGYPFATTREVLTQIGTQIKDLDRVRDAIGLRESAPIDYVVQRIADTRRDMLWAQGTVSMVSAALSGNQTAERTEIMARLSGTVKAQERFATLSNGLCNDLDMPPGDMDAVRRRVRDLVVFEQDVIKTMGGSDRDQVRDGIGVLQSEYKAQAETFTILRQILGLGVGCALTTIVAKVQYLIETGHMHAQGEFAPLDMLNHVLGGNYALPGALDRATGKIKYMQAQTARLCKIVGNTETLHGAVDMVASLASRVGKDDASTASQERRALIRYMDMAESSTWHEITNEVVRRISYTNGVLAGVGDSIKALAQIVGLDPIVAALPVPGPIPSLISYATAIRDSLLAVVGHPGGETLSLNAALSLLQSKVSAVALALGLSKYASLDAAENKIALMPMPAPMPALRELVLTLHTTKTMDANEAMTAAADKIKDMRQALSDLLSTWS